MKKLLLVATLLAPSLAFAAEIPKFPHGYISPNGDQLNRMVDTINGIIGNGGAVTSGYFSLNTGTKTGPTPAAGTIIQAVGANAAATARIEIDAFGGIPVFTARRADGTKAAPTALVSTDEIGSFNYHGAISATAYGPGARMSAFATENWSGTASGSKIVFSTTPNTTQTLTDALTIDQDQSASFVGNIVAAKQLRVIYGTPTIASGACGATTNGVITSGTNQAGLVTIGAAGTTTCTISFSATLSNAPNACVVFPASAGAAATGTTVARVSSISTANFVITGTALASTAYYYLCI